MAQLTGITKRTVVTYIEVVADDNSAVLMIFREGNQTMFRTRLPHEDRWNADSPRFTVNERDTALLSSIVSGADVGWKTAQLAEIPTTAFELPDPNPKVDEAEQQRCAELDIERAKAANLAEQKELLRLELVRDHTLDKHITAYVEDCSKCVDAVSTVLAGRRDLDDPDAREVDPPADMDDERLPF